VTTGYAYDPVGRVLSIAHARGTTALASLGYSHDNVGNPISQQASAAQPLVTQPATATYDDANRLNQRGGTTYTYDANGNLTSENGPNGLTTYTWDSRNRLRSIVAGNGQTSNFTYDFAGNLISQVDSGPTLNVTQNFVLDELTNVAYISRSDGDSLSILAGRFLDQHLAVVHSSGQVEYALTDAINSTVSTVDQSGANNGQFYYEPFGQTTTRGSTYPFRFTGRVPASGSLYYYRARFYDSAVSRFTSEDPFGLRSRAGQMRTSTRSIIRWGLGTQPEKARSLDSIGAVPETGRGHVARICRQLEACITA